MLFHDPMAGGGMNSPGKSVVNYVDLDASSGLRDYGCGTVTYDGHQGTDMEILNFYEMDEGVAVLSAAQGVVIYTHDGEYDRETEGLNGKTANAVAVRHSDDSEAWYLHMRKNSVAVALGNVVEVGDTLGLVGSSGYSYGPHIHFELHHNGVKDPFNGACQPDSSRWIEQADYVMDLPFELMDHGLTTLELSWPVVSERPPTKTHVSAPAVVYSWLRLRNTGRSDDLTWEFYENGSFWNSYTFSPDDTYSSSWWYTYWTLPESSDYQGSWSIKIYRNGEVMAQQDFTYDDNENRLPLAQSEALQLESGSSIEGEFTADDPDAPSSGTKSPHTRQTALSHRAAAASGSFVIRLI